MPISAMFQQTESLDYDKPIFWVYSSACNFRNQSGGHQHTIFESMEQILVLKMFKPLINQVPSITDKIRFYLQNRR